MEWMRLPRSVADSKASGKDRQVAPDLSRKLLRVTFSQRKQLAHIKLKVLRSILSPRAVILRLAPSKPLKRLLD